MPHKLTGTTIFLSDADITRIVSALAADDYLTARLTRRRDDARKHSWPSDDDISDADSVGRADYWRDVRGTAEDIRDRIASGELTDAEALDTAIHESCDGHARIIYTAQAIDTLLWTDSRDAAEDELGGVDSAAGATFEQRAYWAFRADVIDHLTRALDVDLNDPRPADATEEE